MFDGGGDQFHHQFIAAAAAAASRPSSSLSIPLPFSLHGNPPSSSSPSFGLGYDPYTNNPSPPLLQQQLHHHHCQEPADLKNHVVKHALIERARSMDPCWSADEILALLKVRSSFENWFPDFTWEHVSSKLAELGFKRSADEWKEKFEEEESSRRHLTSSTFNYNKTYRIFSELDELYPGDQEQAPEEVSAAEGRTESMHNHQNQEDDDQLHKNIVGLENSSNPFNPQENEQVVEEPLNKKKRKRKRKDEFEIFKGFCEAILNKMIAQQEELHNKLIEEILRRDEEKIAREEAWKQQNMDRILKNIDLRAQEQARASERQAKIIEFLRKFTYEEEDDQQLADKIDDLLAKVNNNNNNSNSSTSICEFPKTHQDKFTETSSSSSMMNNNNSTTHQNPSLISSKNNPKSRTKTPSPLSPSSSLVTRDSKPAPNADTPPSSINHLDSGKRWPRDEVLALINLRCKLNNSGDEGAGKVGPLWERISQGMLELGYKRSAKRCKEKWENINKYFRKNKDSSKKRPVDSKTCPYFHQLSCLYSEGTPPPPPPPPPVGSFLPENQ